MPTLDIGLLKLFVDKLCLIHFENSSTVVRKHVVMTLSELKMAMDVRLLTQS